MFSYDGTKRPSCAEIRAHPWMQTGVNMKELRSQLLEDLSENRSKQTADSSREGTEARGD